MYEGFPQLKMQLSKANEFVPSPDWYYNVEYLQEKERGYDYQEDLYSPGYFEFPIKKGESVVFSASIDSTTPSRFKSKFQKLLEDRSPRDNATHCLRYSASRLPLLSFR
jgi:glycogen debranching enzyme